MVQYCLERVETIVVSAKRFVDWEIRFKNRFMSLKKKEKNKKENLIYK